MNWYEIRGVEGWSDVLTGLLVELSKAIEAKDGAARDARLEDLRAFVKNSPNDVCRPLDDVAIRTVFTVVAKGWEDATAEMRLRSEELARLTKQIREVTRENQETAESLRATRIRAVIDRSTAALQAITDLKATLSQGGASGTDAVLGKIEAAIAAIQGLRAEVERVG